MTPLMKMMLSTASIVGATVLVASGISRAQYYGDGYSGGNNPITGMPFAWDQMNRDRMHWEIQGLLFQQQMDRLNAQREFYRLQQQQADQQRERESQDFFERINQAAAQDAERRRRGSR